MKPVIVPHWLVQIPCEHVSPFVARLSHERDECVLPMETFFLVLIL